MDPGAELLKRVERAQALFDDAVTLHQPRDLNAAEKRYQAALVEFPPLSRT
jgi:hypothetical protein